MPDAFQPKIIEKNFLASDVERVSAEAKKMKESPDHAGKSGEEILRQSIQAVTSTPPAPPGATVAPVSGPLPSYTADISPSLKIEVERLLDIAMTAGIGKASEAARNSSPYILDIFHDAVTGKMYPELKKRGILD